MHFIGKLMQNIEQNLCKYPCFLSKNCGEQPQEPRGMLGNRYRLLNQR